MPEVYNDQPPILHAALLAAIRQCLEPQARYLVEYLRAQSLDLLERSLLAAEAMKSGDTETGAGIYEWYGASNEIAYMQIHYELTGLEDRELQGRHLSAVRQAITTVFDLVKSLSFGSPGHCPRRRIRVASSLEECETVRYRLEVIYPDGWYRTKFRGLPGFFTLGKHEPLLRYIERIPLGLNGKSMCKYTTG